MRRGRERERECVLEMSSECVCVCVCVCAVCRMREKGGGGGGWVDGLPPSPPVISVHVASSFFFFLLLSSDAAAAAALLALLLMLIIRFRSPPRLELLIAVRHCCRKCDNQPLHNSLVSCFSFHIAREIDRIWPARRDEGGREREEAMMAAEQEADMGRGGRGGGGREDAR